MTQIFQPPLIAEFSLAAAIGLVPRYSTLNKFGAASDCDTGIPTDIWDGADGSTSTDIWVAPTQARIHNIVSSDANDTAGGTGMREVEVYGLTSWDADKETVETVALAGETPVPTANAYVVIYRVLSHVYGSGGTNAGMITATAVTDNTITAVIQPGNGQTLMAIFAIPSNYLMALTATHCSMSGNATAVATGQLLVKQNADQSTAGWVVKRSWEFSRAAHYDETFLPPTVFQGPCIVKVQVVSNTVNVSCAATIEGYIINANDRPLTSR